MTERLDVTIVTWNNHEEITGCLESLTMAGRPGLDVVVTVVDNASTDGTAQEARRALDQHHLVGQVIERSANDGFAMGANAGLATAEGRWWMVLNPDTVVPAHGLSALVDTQLATRGPAIVSPAFVDGDGSLMPVVEDDLTIGRLLWRVVRGQRSRARRPPEAGSPIEVDWVHGAALVMPVTLARSLRGFDERFFLYAEDMDLCRRARRRGARVLVAPDVRITHQGGASAGRAGSPGLSAARRVVALGTFLRLHHGPWAARIYGSVVIATRGMPALAHRLRGSGDTVSAAMTKAGWSLLRHGELSAPASDDDGGHGAPPR